MNAPVVEIVRTGVANTASLRAAFRRLGAEVEVVETPERVQRAELLVLPGVGAFGAGMQRLRERRLVDPLTTRINAGRPTLAVCLGMQLLGAASEESPGVDGLNIIDAVASRFPDFVRAPQMGWNSVAPMDSDDPLIRPGYAYFANSYRFLSAPEGWSVALSDHAGPFVAAMQRSDVLACQFHPELSGRWGLELLQRWMNAAARAEGAMQPC